MKTLTNHEWASIALLSIVVPVSLLTTFRLTGVLREPPKPETITVEAVSWNMSRPRELMMIEQEVKNHYSNTISSVSLNVEIFRYSENYPDSPSWGGDYLDLGISATANTSEGFIYSIVVKFSRTETSADVVFQQTPSSMELHNLQIKKIQDLTASKREASFEASAVNQPKNSLLSITTYWMFLDQNDQDHWVTITLEATYFNGLTYQKVMVPINLGVTKF